MRIAHNIARIEYFMDKIRKELWIVRNRKIAMWGLAIKPNTDDVHFPSALELLLVFIPGGAGVSAFHPQAMDEARVVFPQVRYSSNPYEAAHDAEAVLIVTEWDGFRDIDWDRVRRAVDRPPVLDGRNALDGEELNRHGFSYVSVGRPPLASHCGKTEGSTPISFVREQIAEAR